MELIVAKFGGTSIGNGQRIRKAAQSIVNAYMEGNKVVVVVSAINKTTDDLVAIADESIGKEVTEKQLAEILSMGERTSIRVFSSVLESLGVKSEYIDPSHDLWPVITDDNYGKAQIDFEKTEEQSQGLLGLLDQGIIPVVCGFLGRTENGEVTTLGRGGSDVTAFLLGHCLNADNVIIVTDVDGVMSTDPRKINEAEKLDYISVEEMRDLATHGAQVLHPHALRFKDPEIKAKIISFEKGDLSDPGTEIVGPFEDSMNKSVCLHSEPISVVALVGEDLLNQIGLIAKMTTLVAEANINIYGISAGQNSITLFLDKCDADEAYHLLHNLVIAEDSLSSISLGRDIAMLTMINPDFIETPGVITEITNPLKEAHINIVEISSSQTAIVLFINWEDGKVAYDLIKGVL
ncbi:MAG: aspartate kinase [Methanobrevibacter ruminantium]|uniref:aspartate kinase n=1 Tax=Methanobrevibacter ruminantium TaxID=83816 RepID=UPI0026EB69AA|nr:aspartate kinase [Methanobrevibacter ruminantium]MCI5737343.1 aspartate kinase [Methanobrevibacter ruminantium]MDD6048339.1 aspartate kinase [Methanobrevibacter ruminantium]MDO5842593.1 aspartate kinase [Methanobrevibacter ruminantium]